MTTERKGRSRTRDLGSKTTRRGLVDVAGSRATGLQQIESLLALQPGLLASRPDADRRPALEPDFAPGRGSAAGLAESLDADYHALVCDRLLSDLESRFGLPVRTVDFRTDTVYLDPKRVDPARPHGHWVLAHELAHVALSRLPFAPASASLAEREAGSLADAFLAGAPTLRPSVALPVGHVAADTGGRGRPALLEEDEAELRRLMEEAGQLGQAAEQIKQQLLGGLGQAPNGAPALDQVASEAQQLLLGGQQLVETVLARQRLATPARRDRPAAPADQVNTLIRKRTVRHNRTPRRTVRRKRTGSRKPSRSAPGRSDSAS